MAVRRRRTTDHPSIRPLTGSPRINILVYGHPGCGKTTLAGSSPGNCLILRPVVDHTDSIIGKSKAKEWPLRNWDDAFEALDWIRENNGGGYDWIWLDSISLFQDIGLDDIWSGVIAEKPHRRKYGLDRSEYGVNMFRLSQMIRHLVGAEVANIGITAHPAEMENPFADDEDESANIGVIQMPWIQGRNMASKVCGYMNIVGYMQVRKDGKRVLITQPTERYYAKDQFDAFQNGRLLNPTMPRLVEKINGAVQTKE